MTKHHLSKVLRSHPTSRQTPSGRAAFSEAADELDRLMGIIAGLIKTLKIIADTTQDWDGAQDAIHKSALAAIAKAEPHEDDQHGNSG